MSKTIHRLAVVALALGLGLVGMVPAMAGDDASIIDNNLDEVIANDLPTIIEDVDGGVAHAPAAVGGLLGGLLGGGNGLVGGLLAGENGLLGGLLGGENGLVGGVLAGENGLVGGLLGGPGGILGGILGGGDRLAILPTGGLASIPAVVDALGHEGVPTTVGARTGAGLPAGGDGLLGGGGLLGGLLGRDSIIQALAGRL